MEENQNEYLEYLKKEISNFYNEHSKIFINKYENYGLDDCHDAYQEAVLEVFEFIQRGGVDKKGDSKVISNVRGYLFTVAKHKLYDIMNDRNRGYDLIKKLKLEIDLDEQASYQEFTIDEEHSDNEYLKKLKAAYNELSEKCKRIIDLYYFQKIDLLKIATMMEYESYEVAKQRLYHCRQSLRKKI